MVPSWEQCEAEQTRRYLASLSRKELEKTTEEAKKRWMIQVEKQREMDIDHARFAKEIYDNIHRCR